MGGEGVAPCCLTQVGVLSRAMRREFLLDMSSELDKTRQVAMSLIRGCKDEKNRAKVSTVGRR